MTHILQGLDVVRYFDDILVGGESEKELLHKTKLLFERFDEYGLTINYQKCDWCYVRMCFLKVNRTFFTKRHRVFENPLFI